MKKSFTMIELIFVIVIIGILAAIAIPKLSATRTDAEATAIAQEVQGAIQEVIADATAKGGDLNATALIERSQILKQIVKRKKGYEWASTGSDPKIKNGVEIYGDIYGDCSGDNRNKCRCVSFFEQNETTLSVETNPHSNGPICSEVKKLLRVGEWGRTNGAKYNITGSNVNF